MMNRIKTGIFSLACLTVAFALPAQAETPTGGQIATVNIQSILSNSAAAKSAKSQIEAKLNEYQNETKKMETSLRKEEASFKEQRNLLSPEALKQKEEELRNKVNSAQKNQLEKRNRLAEANNQALGDIQDAVMKIVENLVKNKGIKVVIPTNNLLYATPDLDITKEVLAQLDKDLPSVKINFNAAPQSDKKGEKSSEKK